MIDRAGRGGGVADAVARLGDDAVRVSVDERRRVEGRAEARVCGVAVRPDERSERAGIRRVAARMRGCVAPEERDVTEARACIGGGCSERQRGTLDDAAVCGTAERRARRRAVADDRGVCGRRRRAAVDVGDLNRAGFARGAVVGVDDARGRARLPAGGRPARAEVGEGIARLPGRAGGERRRAGRARCGPVVERRARDGDVAGRRRPGQGGRADDVEGVAVGGGEGAVGGGELVTGGGLVDREAAEGGEAVDGGEGGGAGKGSGGVAGAGLDCERDVRGVGGLVACTGRGSRP